MRARGLGTLRCPYTSGAHPPPKLLLWRMLPRRSCARARSFLHKHSYCFIDTQIQSPHNLEAWRGDCSGSSSRDGQVMAQRVWRMVWCGTALICQRV